MTDKVLIVEDDFDIADLIKVNLQELGIQTEHLSDGRTALARALEQEFSLLILDVMLPNVSGLDICRQVREAKPEQAILMLTAKNSETDRVLGLELGADDYMTKPFSVRELQARVRSQIRKLHTIQERIEQKLQSSQQASAEEKKLLTVGNLTINQQEHSVKLEESNLDLTATEFDLLLHFAKHPDQVFSRSQLLESVWGYQHCGYEHTVNSHINRLRSKIEMDVAHPKVIQTVWGVGYKLSFAGVAV